MTKSIFALLLDLQAHLKPVSVTLHVPPFRHGLGIRSHALNVRSHCLPVNPCVHVHTYSELTVSMQ